MKKLLALAVMFGCIATGCEDSGGVDGCGSDADCKGDRICLDGECVDPGGDGTTGGSDSTDGSDTSDTGGSVDTGDTGGSVDTGDTGSTGDTDSTGDTGGSVDTGGPNDPPGWDGVSDDELEQACIADCEAMRSPGCEENLISLDQCTATCLLLDASLEGYCFRENRDYYACKAEGGYACLDGRPVPHSSCIEEQRAMTECRNEVPCRKYCRTAKKESCADDEASCVEDCKIDRIGLDTSCAYRYDSLIRCWSNTMVCESGRPSILGCEEDVAEVAWCLGVYSDNCRGYCWAAEILGCGSADCGAQCQTNLSLTSCGSDYRSLLTCMISHSSINMGCSEGKPVALASCVSQQQEFDSCLQERQ